MWWYAQDIGTGEGNPLGFKEVNQSKPLGVIMILKPGEKPENIRRLQGVLPENMKRQGVEISLTVLKGYEKDVLQQLKMSDTESCQAIIVDIDPTVNQAEKDNLTHIIEATQAKQIATTTLPISIETTYVSDNPFAAQDALAGILKGLPTTPKVKPNILAKDTSFIPSIQQNLKSLATRISQVKPVVFPGQR